jgi:DDE superfamily endonuclease
MGRFSGPDSRVVRDESRRHQSRGLRTSRSTDRTAARPDAGPEVPQGLGPEVAARPRHPRAAQNNLAEHLALQADFRDARLKPALDAARAGQGPVFVVDAAHFVLGTFLCGLGSLAPIFVRAASGRQRFHVLGAWNARTRELIRVTNTTVVNTETMCQRLGKIAASGLTGSITLVLDHARSQRHAVVQAWASQLAITLLDLPSSSPNLNLIERLGKFIQRRVLDGRYHPTFADFQAAIQQTLAGLPTTHAEPLKTLMTLKFQTFEDVSLGLVQFWLFLGNSA